jgi:hypothetical protein
MNLEENRDGSSKRLPHYFIHWPDDTLAGRWSGRKGPVGRKKICTINDYSVKKVKNASVRSTTLLSQVEFFCVVTPYSVLVGYQRFRGPYCLHLQGD